MSTRINYLDGHRGVAIMLVVFFHAFARWTTLVPYGDAYSNNPIFEYGHLGVQLFFIISGYVILMTLEKCNGIWEFIYRRWLRLFPAMLLCSLLIFLTASIFSARPGGPPTVSQLLPGITFIEPSWLNIVTGESFESLEGAFWSLYVEVKFYVLAALCYFFINRKALMITLVIAFVAAVLTQLLNDNFSSRLLSRAHTVTRLLSFEHFGWFSAGASYYIFVKSADKTWLYFGFVMSIASSIVVGELLPGPTIMAIALSTLFVTSLLNTTLQRFLSNRVFLLLGFVSYPLYLIHENMMISIIIQLHEHFGWLPAAALFCLAFGAVLFVAYITARHVEKPVKSMITNAVSWLIHIIREFKQISKRAFRGRS